MMTVSDLHLGERKNCPPLFFVGLAIFMLLYRGLSLLAHMDNRWAEPPASFLVFMVCSFAQE